MRAFCVLAVLLAGCQFSVIGSATGDPAAGAAAPAPGGMTQPQSPPTSSAPPPGITDAGVAPVDVDMSVQRVGTACIVG